MAELPRYQRAGNMPADIPQLSFANVKEAARLSSNMGAALDKVSAFALGAVKERIDEENKIVGIQMRGELELLANEKMAEFKQKLQTGGYQSHEDMRQDVLSLQGLWKGLANSSVRCRAVLHRRSYSSVPFSGQSQARLPQACTSRTVRRGGGGGGEEQRGNRARNSRKPEY